VVAKWALYLSAQNPIVCFLKPNGFAVGAAKVLRHFLTSIAVIAWDIFIPS